MLPNLALDPTARTARYNLGVRMARDSLVEPLAGGMPTVVVGMVRWWILEGNYPGPPEWLPPRRLWATMSAIGRGRDWAAARRIINLGLLNEQ